MHEMRTIVTDVSVSLFVCYTAQLGFTVQPLPNHFGLLISLLSSNDKFS